MGLREEGQGRRSTQERYGIKWETDKRTMARDQETKKRAERRIELRMGRLEGRCSRKRRKRKKNYSQRMTEKDERKKRKGLETD